MCPWHPIGNFKQTCQCWCIKQFISGVCGSLFLSMTIIIMDSHVLMLAEDIRQNTLKQKDHLLLIYPMSQFLEVKLKLNPHNAKLVFPQENKSLWSAATWAMGSQLLFSRFPHAWHIWMHTVDGIWRIFRNSLCLFY